MNPSVALSASPILIIAGTRPEIIKLAPVYKQLKLQGHPVLFCATMQQQHLSMPALEFFEITSDFCLQVADPGQSLTWLSSKLLQQLEPLFSQIKPLCVIVQGDTMTAACASLAAFLQKIPVVHVEAGLRTGDLESPFPEEFNRRICSLTAVLHFAPTEQAQQNLLAEGFPADEIVMVGNTVVDALKQTQNKIADGNVLDKKIAAQLQTWRQQFSRLVLLTMHRRESHGYGLDNLANALLHVAQNYEGKLAIIYPKHPNPATDSFAAFLQQALPAQVFVLPPLSYADFVNLLQQVNVVMTDSGGILEEASVLGKNIVCVREKTERPESLLASNVQLCGFSFEGICQALDKALASATVRSASYFNPIFGDGTAAIKIVEHLEKTLLAAKMADAQGFTPARQDNEQKREERVAIFGLGYIGLPTAILLADAGFSVTGIDIDQAKLEQIRKAKVPYLENNLALSLKRVLAQHLLQVSDKLTEAVDYFVVCVPTPLHEKQADTSAVFSCVQTIAPLLQTGSLVLLESTVPVGTTQQFAESLAEASGLRLDKDFFVAYCPERVLPGNILGELVDNNRVIGVENAKAFVLASKLYKSFCRGNLTMASLKTAELVKLLENSYRNLQVAFANEVFDIAAQLGVDAHELISLANQHPRVKILNPGPGVGGHCIAVDPLFLSQQAHCPLLQLAITRNQQRPQTLAQQVVIAANGRRRKVVALGLTYKPNVPDLRESPAAEVVRLLANEPNITLKIFDPLVAQTEFGQLHVDKAEVENAINKADIVLVLVAHDAFKSLLKRVDLADKIVFDPTCLLAKIGKKLSAKNFQASPHG